MSKFADMRDGEAIAWLQEYPPNINTIDFKSVYEQDKLVKILKVDPSLFLALNEKNYFEDACAVYIERNPNLFAILPDKLRTAKTKLALLKRSPGQIVQFTEKDFDEKTVKYIYIHYPPLLEDIDDKKIAKKINNFIAKFKKQGVEQEYSEEENWKEI